jgi:outer membrane protein assembly factor BamB
MKKITLPSRALLALLFLGATAAAAAGHWPSFRGERARGLGAGTPPTSFDVAGGKNLLWKTAIPGLGLSSPVIWGDHIFLTTAISADSNHSLRVGLYGDINTVPDTSSHQFVVLALDRKSGKILWQHIAHEGVPQGKRHEKSSHANPTAATDGERVIAFFGSEGLYAYDFAGKLLWKRDLGKLDSAFYMVPASEWGFSSSPILHKGRVIIQADVLKGSFLMALDAKTGETIWKTERTDVPTWSTPTIFEADGKTQIVVNGFKHLGGYDFETGAPLWWLKSTGDIPVPTPIEAHGLLYFSSAHGPGSPIWAIKPSARGELKLAEGSDKGEHIAWSLPKGGSYMQTSLVVGDQLFVCKDAGVLTAYDAKSGQQLYQQRLATGQTGFTASGVAAAATLYYTAETGEVFVVKAGPTFEEVGRGSLGEPILATPAIAEGQIFFRGKDHLIAIGAKN